MFNLRSFFLSAILITFILGCAKEEPTISVNYTILRQWKPQNISSAFGAEILLHDDLSKSEIIAFIKQIGNRKNPVVIKIYLSRIAYDNQNNNIFDEKYKKGYLLYYIKNNKRGTNEIRWFQEIGKFSHLNGQKTKLSSR